MREAAVERSFPSGRTRAGCAGAMAVVLSALLFGVSLVFAWMVIDTGAKADPMLSTALSGLATLALVGGVLPALFTRRLTTIWKRPVLVLDAVGVHAPQQGKLMRWAEIASARIDSRGDAVLLRLEPRHPDPARKFAAFVGTSTNINLDLCAVRSDDVVAAVRAHPCYRGDDAQRDGC